MIKIPDVHKTVEINDGDWSVSKVKNVLFKLNFQANMYKKSLKCSENNSVRTGQTQPADEAHVM